MLCGICVIGPEDVAEPSYVYREVRVWANPKRNPNPNPKPIPNPNSKPNPNPSPKPNPTPTPIPTPSPNPYPYPETQEIGSPIPADEIEEAIRTVLA